MTHTASTPSSGAPLPWSRWLAAAGCCVLLFLMFRPGTVPKPLSQQYPGPWSDTFSLPISRALDRHGAGGCGEMWHRAAADSGSEFLVYCSAGGAQWTAYLVWTSSGDVMGPLKPSADVPPPR